MKFRHYRGGLYALLTIAKHTETEEVLVVYGGCGDGATGIWARPYPMFHEDIRCPYCDSSFKRFQRTDEEGPTPCECHKIATLAKKHGWLGHS